MIASSKMMKKTASSPVLDRSSLVKDMVRPSSFGNTSVNDGGRGLGRETSDGGAGGGAGGGAWSPSLSPGAKEKAGASRNPSDPDTVVKMERKEGAAVGVKKDAAKDMGVELTDLSADRSGSKRDPVAAVDGSADRRGEGGSVSVDILSDTGGDDMEGGREGGICRALG